MAPARARCTRSSTGATTSSDLAAVLLGRRAPCSRPRSSCTSPRASTTAGRSATTTGRGTRSCSRRSTVATRRKARARRFATAGRSRDIGDRTTLCSTTARCSRRAIDAAPSSRSTVRNPHPVLAGRIQRRLHTLRGRQAVRRMGSVCGRIRRIDTIPNTRCGARPMGLAQGPDGALYVTETSRARIGSITYKRRPRHIRSRSSCRRWPRARAQQAHIRKPARGPTMSSARRPSPPARNLRDLLRVVPPARRQGRWRPVPAAGRDQLGVRQQAAADLCRSCTA